MSRNDESFQIATLVILTFTGVVLVSYILIFLDPRIAFNPFKPPRSMPTIAAIAPTLIPAVTPLPTRTPTATPTLTPSPIPTSTWTLVPSPSVMPTLIPILTPRVTLAATATSISVPITPTLAPIMDVLPTPALPPYSFRPVLQSCTHSGGTAIKGFVRAGPGFEGLRIILAVAPDARRIIEGGEQTLRFQPNGTAEYSYALKIIGSFDAPATWYLWLVDATGKPVSDPRFAIQTNNLPPEYPASCWLAVVDFVR